MRGLRVLPHCSVPREGMGWGRVGHSHSAKSPGDRTSGFNGLSTQGSPGPNPGSGEGRGGFPGGGAIARPLLPLTVFSLSGHLWEASWAPRKWTRELKAGQAPDSCRQCPEGQDALAAFSGDPQSRPCPEAPRNPVGTSVFVSLSAIFLSS